MIGIFKSKPRRRPGAAATRRTPARQAAREGRGDPFPPQPEWTDEELDELNDRPAPSGGSYQVIRKPEFTPSPETEARVRYQAWLLLRQGRIREARRLAAQFPGLRLLIPDGQRGGGGRPRGPAQTAPQQAYRPAAARPYVQQEQPQWEQPRIHPLPHEPVTAPQIRLRRRAAARVRTRQQMPVLAYPEPDGLSAHAEEYAALMRRVSHITGMRSPYEDPAAWRKPALVPESGSAFGGLPEEAVTVYEAEDGVRVSVDWAAVMGTGRRAS